MVQILQSDISFLLTSNFNLAPKSTCHTIIKLATIIIQLRTNEETMDFTRQNSVNLQRQTDVPNLMDVIAHIIESSACITKKNIRLSFVICTLEKLKIVSMATFVHLRILSKIFKLGLSILFNRISHNLQDKSKGH